MKIFNKLYCRCFQGVMRIALPFLPYRQPKLLDNYEQLASVVRDNNIDNILIVTDKTINSLGLTKHLEESLKNNKIDYVIFDKTVANPTTDNVEDARQIYLENNCKGLVAIGGGSSIDCAKAVGARIVKPKKSLAKMKGLLKINKKIPLLIAIPTTAGTGSETTLASVIVDSKTRHKYAINDFSLIPHYALLDSNLTLNLPPFVTATTGLDALTHSIEAYIGRSTTKQTRQNALESIKMIFENLYKVYQNGQDKEGRENMLIASYKAGVAFTKSYVGYVHAIAHSLGGQYNVAHGLANAVILPIMLRFYGKSIHKKLWEIGIYVGFFDKNTSFEEGAEIVISKIEDLNKKMSIGTTIKELKESDIDYLAHLASKEANPLYPVPVEYDEKELRDVYFKILEK